MALASTPSGTKGIEMRVTMWSSFLCFALTTAVSSAHAQSRSAPAPAAPVAVAVQDAPPATARGAAAPDPAATDAAGAVGSPKLTVPAPGDDEEEMTFRSSRSVDMQRFAESSLQEIKVVGTRPRYAMNLFGDLTLGSASRSEGSLRKPSPAFGVGVFDMLFTADLDSKITMTSEIAFTYEPNAPLAELERLHLRWKPSKFFFVEVGRFHTDLGYWNVAYHHGKFLQLSIERPRMLLLHGGILPTHWIGAQAGVSVPVGTGTVSLVGSVGTARERIGSAGHALHGSNLTAANAGHGKLEFSGFLHRDLRFGVSGVLGVIPDEAAFVRPGLPDQSMNEKVGNAFIAFPSLPFSMIAEAYIIEHSLNSTARPEMVGSRWRTAGAFVILGYQIGRVTPYIRGEYIGSQVGAYIFDPFYYPEPRSIEGFKVSLDAKEGVIGTRIDLSEWNSLKLEYQLMTGVGTRRADAPTPAIHTGLVSWSFGI